ncbi:unnamed protein product [Protopolystoma xenopodis]|uniref:Uncharacterized protein n=1 Tax=Protopolystoma xenopodis TaxID=117903 RepID=A0A3S5CUU0_9PLAT|nr:unnamed protein product [Protopolystoma xenopodis]
MNVIGLCRSTHRILQQIPSTLCPIRIVPLGLPSYPHQRHDRPCWGTSRRTHKLPNPIAAALNNSEPCQSNFTHFLRLLLCLRAAFLSDPNVHPPLGRSTPESSVARLRISGTGRSAHKLPEADEQMSAIASNFIAQLS